MSDYPRCGNCRWCHVESVSLVHCHKGQWDYPAQAKLLRNVGFICKKRGCDYYDSMDEGVGE